MSKPENIFESLAPIHKNLDPMVLEFPKHIGKTKYFQPGEIHHKDLTARVVGAFFSNNGEDAAKYNEAFAAIENYLFMPAGRILAGAGTAKAVTLNNCYVTGTIDDSMQGIMKEHTNFALTMQQGGGDGADFSPIRPEGAILKRTGTRASGPLPFMDMWNSMCTTIRSAGDRRGAMMATISDTHPDMPKVVVAKRTAGRLTNFNISILVSDAFMAAVEDDSEWLLYFHEAPFERNPDCVLQDFVDDAGVLQYVYSVWRARDLWKMITLNTYEYSEPGVIFIDRVNDLNNLSYCEEIRCTNPCGEQPLPPHGACNLGHVNLARMVIHPFTAQARINYELLKRTVRIAVDFLDRVIDVTNFPLEEQRLEQQRKRRIGLGITGLADLLAQMCMKYGSWKSVQLVQEIMEHITEETYKASIELAKERGSFPAFNSLEYFATESYAATKLPSSIQADIHKYGIRNGVLQTVAPTGTTSIYYGNLAGGLEPNFAHIIKRNVRSAHDDNVWEQHASYSYTALLFREAVNMGIVKLLPGQSIDDPYTWPSYMVTAQSLTIEDHLLIMAKVQEYVDASVSKTINVPESTTYEEFVKVYEMAYKLGCKGCTTYRPSAIRGSILEDASSKPTTSTSDKPVVGEAGKGDSKETLVDRPEMLFGSTYKIKWPNRGAALYLTVNSDADGRPYEVFITSKDSSYGEWTTALSLMITGLYRKGGDISFIANELKQIQSIRDGAWIKGKYYGSLPAYIGVLLERHMQSIINQVPLVDDEEMIPVEATPAPTTTTELATCPSCSSPSLTFVEGCKKCSACGFSECG